MATVTLLQPSDMNDLPVSDSATANFEADQAQISGTAETSEYTGYFYGTFSGGEGTITRFMFDTSDSLDVPNYDISGLLFFASATYASTILVPGNFLRLIDDLMVGKDTVTGSSGADTLLGFAGNDVLQGGDGNDSIRGGSGSDQLFGGSGNDTLAGDALPGFDRPHDVLTGGPGSDSLDGGRGVDWASYATAATGVVVSLDGSLTNTGDATGDVFSGIEGLQGSPLADVLRGDTSANELRGLSGNDRLQGLSGDDLLYGGLGKDTLTGNAGADTFQYRAVNEGGDRVTDFIAADDGFSFRASAFGGLPLGVLAANRFQVRPDNVAQDADDRFIFRTTDKTLWFDANGSGAGGLTLIAGLQASATMTNADIVLV